MAEILHMPSQECRKTGRLRLHPVPDVPLADVLPIAPRTATREEYDETIDTMAHGLLTAIRAFTAFSRKYPRD